MMVIGPNGEQMGVKKRGDALTLASYAGLDLVLLNASGNPAVAKIMDYNKYRYEKQKKLKEQQKRQRENNKELKEYQLSVTIDIGDFNTRKKNAYDYLVKGHKIKASIRFKGRQMAHTELGAEVPERFAKEPMKPPGTALASYRRCGIISCAVQWRPSLVLHEIG